MFLYILQISIGVPGLYFSIKTSPQMVTQFINLGFLKEYNSNYQNDMQLINILNPGLTFILGMICLLKSKSVLSIIKRMKGELEE